MTPIEINLSQSALGYHGCIQELKFTAIDGYYNLPSSNIVYGEAIHKYRHMMFQTGGFIPFAREAALKTFNQPKVSPAPRSQHMGDQNHMLTTCFNFWEVFVKEIDIDTEYVVLNDKPATEISFSIPYYEDSHIKVNLCGTLDGIGKIKNGCYILPDIKTTSSWDSAAFFGTFKLSRQLRYYLFAIKLMSQLYPDSIIGQIGKTRIGVRIDGVFIKPAASDNKYIKSDIMFVSDEEMLEFRRLLDSKIQELSLAVKNNYYPKHGILNNSCIGKWGMCSFANVCANSKEIGDILLERDFKKRVFTPLNYSGL